MINPDGVGNQAHPAEAFEHRLDLACQLLGLGRITGDDQHHVPKDIGRLIVGADAPAALAFDLRKDRVAIDSAIIDGSGDTGKFDRIDDDFYAFDRGHKTILPAPANQASDRRISQPLRSLSSVVA
jgi:hypothetical protein